MGRILDTVSGFVTAPTATLVAWTMATGDSLAVRAAVPGSNIWLIGAWAWNQVAGVMRVRSPRLHDNVEGLRMRVPVNLVINKIPVRDIRGAAQKLFTQDTLIVEQSGSGVAGQIETGSLLIWYDNVPGVEGRYIGQELLKKNGVNIMMQEVAVTSGVAGGYSGSVLINSFKDNFKANTDYALVGGFVDTRVATVRIKGIDTGNVGVSFPGDPGLADVTDNWFAGLSEASGLPMIPVLNSQNKGAITVDVVAQQAAVAVEITLVLVELAQGTAPTPALPAAQPGA